MSVAEKTVAPPRRTQRGDTRLALIKAASALMRERDTLDVTLNDIAARAKSNSALIKYYFGSKEGLLFAVLEHDIQHALKALERLLETGLPPVKMMRRHLTGLVRTYAQIPYLNRLIQAMTRDASAERVAQIASDIVRPITEAQAQILKKGVEAGVFLDVDPTSFYFQAIGSAGCLYSQRFVLRAAFGRESISPDLHERNVQQVVDVLLRGITVPNEAPRDER